MDRRATLSYIAAQRAVAVLRLSEADLFEAVAGALYEGGIRVIEITMTVPNAIDLIRTAAATAPSDVLIGVGSVLDAETATRAVEAGARFVVSPITKPDIIHRANELEVPVMPGAFTPTEIQTAWELGADVVKVFPADVAGMPFFKSVLAPLPHLRLMPTGGVSLTNGRQWLDAGAWAIGIGSALVDNKAVQARDFERIRANAETLTHHLNGDRP